jgi:hypothetical protein
MSVPKSHELSAQTHEHTLSVVKTPNYVDKETITKITGTGGTLKGLVAAEKLHLEFAETRSSAQMRLCC